MGRRRGGAVLLTLTRADLADDALTVAPRLLGALLSRDGVTLRITEVEAYLGELDPGSHAFRGRTPRTAVMFGEPGHLYAYFTYGMHTCANVVCGPEGTASAVLLRAGEIVAGQDAARARRPSARSDAELARGPARLALALGIPLADTGADLFAPPYALEAGQPAMVVATSPRTGVSGDGGSDAFPWRFFLPGDPTVSPYRPHAPRRRTAGPAS